MEIALKEEAEARFQLIRSGIEEENRSSISVYGPYTSRIRIRIDTVWLSGMEEENRRLKGSLLIMKRERRELEMEQAEPEIRTV